MKICILESHKNEKHDIYICVTKNIVLGPLIVLQVATKQERYMKCQKIS